MANNHEQKIERPDLEGIAKKLANLEEEQKIDQVMPSVMDSFFNAKGVKYKDEDGVEHYKTKFTEKEAEKMADKVYDAFVHHSIARTYKGANNKTLDELKKLENGHGETMADNHATLYFGLTRKHLREAFKNSKNKLSLETLLEILKEPLKHHRKYHQNQVFTKLKPEHLHHVKNFIKHNMESHKLDKDIYDVSDKYEIQDLIQPFASIATQHYKDYQAPAKKEE